MFGNNLNEYNKIICFSGLGSSKNFQCSSVNLLSGLDFLEKTQCLPLYRYEGSNKIENITDWGLEQFRKNYLDQKIKKENIFNYVYGVLHNPEYRKKYEQNLKRDFPRIPFYEDFWKWEHWGQQLMELHLNYETAARYQVTRRDQPLKNPQAVPKTKLKANKIDGIIEIDEITTLLGIPAVAWEYKLGNRSALEWILDQYKEKKPSDPTIAEQFNNYKFSDYKENVIELLERVCTVSVATMHIIEDINKNNEMD